jgi:F-type H+-transporting ATPase subunit b
VNGLRMQKMKSATTKATRLSLAVLAMTAVSTAAMAAEGGMPQLDFGNPLMLAQVVWLLIIFGVFYYVLSAIVLPRPKPTWR